MLEHETDLVRFTGDGLHQLVLTMGQSIKKQQGLTQWEARRGRCRE